MTLAFFSVMTLGILVNWFAGALLAFTIFFYVVIYTMALKRWTAQNIVIGGAAGALPPVVAWAAATGSLSVEPLLLFLIIFFWTPPHFWALALFRTDDYARAGVPMLPVVAGPDATRLQILLYTIVLVAVAFAPWPLGYFDAVYGVTSLVLGAGMLALAVNVYRRREEAEALRATRKLFAFSILYLFALFATLLLEVVAHAARAVDLVGGAWRDDGRQAGARRDRPHRGAEEEPPPALDRHCARARRSGRAVFRGHHRQGAGRAECGRYDRHCDRNRHGSKRRPNAEQASTAANRKRAAAWAAMRWWLRSAASSWC